VYFRNLGHKAEGYDPYQDEWKWPPVGKFDFVQCLFVLNVLPLSAERVDVLRRVKGHMRAQGRALVAVRGPGDLKPRKTWTRACDGWITGRGTFQRAFTRDELTQLCRRAGFKVLDEDEVKLGLPREVTWVVLEKGTQ
jgi:hypothetical protein